MECHVELIIGVALQVPVTKEDIELLIKMVSGYLHGVGGTPQILASTSEDVLWISVAGMESGKGAPPIRSEQLDKDYARSSVVRALKEAGIHYGMVGVAKKPLPVLREDSPGTGDAPGQGQQEKQDGNVPDKPSRSPRKRKLKDPVE
jgi:hypothetical protein